MKIGLGRETRRSKEIDARMLNDIVRRDSIDSIKEKNRRIRDLENQIDHLNQVIDDLSQAARKTEEDRDNLEGTFVGQADRINQLEERLGELEEELTTARARHVASMAAADARDRDVATLRAELDAALEEVDRLQGELDAIDEQV